MCSYRAELLSLHVLRIKIFTNLGIYNLKMIKSHYKSVHYLVYRYILLGKIGIVSKIVIASLGLLIQSYDLG